MSERALHVVLFEPEIHWNTGNAGRTCLAAGNPWSLQIGSKVQGCVNCDSPVEDSSWEPNGLTHHVRFYKGGGTYPNWGFPPLLTKSACCVRCGGSWKRDYGPT